MTVLLTGITIWIGTTLTGTTGDTAVARSQLEFLRPALDEGAGEAMQSQFPEGFYFTHVLYGLAWTNLADAGAADRREAGANAQWALERLATPSGTDIFPAELPPGRGAFYSGWTLMLRAERCALVRDEVVASCNELGSAADVVATAYEQALDDDASPFLASYRGQSWPVDNVVAMAALRRADQVTGADHGALIDRWKDRALALVDPGTGLLPHRTDPDSGRALQGARATSQSLIQRFWPLIDRTGAPAAYARYRELFVTTTLGFAGIREYPAGIDGPGDVDSGPLVLGVSASASVVTAGTALGQGDEALASALLHEVDVFGLPVDIGVGRRYAFGALPVADAFIAWARSTPPSAATDHPAVMVWWPLALVPPWLAVLVLWYVASIRWRRPKPASTGP